MNVDGNEAKVAAPERRRSSTALRVLVAGLLGALLYIAHAAFIPIALSVLLALVLSSPVEALHKRGLPRSAGASLIILLVLGLIAGGVNLLWEPAQQWLAAAPRTVKIIERKVGPAAQFLQRIDAITNRAGHFADGTARPVKCDHALDEAFMDGGHPLVIGPVSGHFGEQPSNG